MSGSSVSDYQVVGRVGFGNLMQLREAGEAAIAAAGDRVVIDLSRLENGNSAAVALLIAWFRAAEGQDKAIEFAGAPAELENIVELSGLIGLLPLKGGRAVVESATLPAEAGR